METLEDQLNAGIRRYKNWGEKNQQAAFAVFALAVLAIIAATMLSTLDDKDSPPKWIRGFVAAFPGVMLLINSTFRFESKSRWHWEKTRGYEELLRALTIEQMPSQEVSRKLSKLDQRMDEKWISFGHLPTVSTKNH